MVLTNFFNNQTKKPREVCVHIYTYSPFSAAQAHVAGDDTANDSSMALEAGLGDSSMALAEGPGDSSMAWEVEVVSSMAVETGPLQPARSMSKYDW